MVLLIVRQTSTPCMAFLYRSPSGPELVTDEVELKLEGLRAFAHRIFLHCGALHPPRLYASHRLV
eukprot:11652244-Karenia_brevis.AAC.1